MRAGEAKNSCRMAETDTAVATGVVSPGFHRLWGGQGYRLMPKTPSVEKCLRGLRHFWTWLVPSPIIKKIMCHNLSW